MLKDRSLSFWLLRVVSELSGTHPCSTTPDRLICLPPMFRRCNSRGDGLGGRAGAQQKSGYQRFHSPLEQSVLEEMLTAAAPCVMVIARKLEQAHLPPASLRALREGIAAIVGMEDTTRRLTAELAARRNDWVAEHAARIVVAHASTEGNLMRQARQWGCNGRHIDYLS